MKESMSTALANAQQARAREARCTKLAQWLAGEFLRQLDDYTLPHWAVVAQQAGVLPPSGEDFARVKEILRRRLA